MIKEYNLSGICYTAQRLITLRKALIINKNIYYFQLLDLDTLGYIEQHEYEEEIFVPVSFNGKYFKEVD